MPTDYTIPAHLRDKDFTTNAATPYDDLHVECYRDFGVFCKTWFPKRFHMPYTYQHRQVINLLNEVFREQQQALRDGKRPGRKVAIEGDRGSAKTGFCVHGLPARQALYGEAHYIPVISKSHGKSVDETTSLKDHLSSDPGIRLAFGDVRAQVEEQTGNEGDWGKLAFVIASQFGVAKIQPLGVGMPIRGRTFGEHRPDLIVLDDFDDEMNWLRNDELRKKYHKEWFPGAVLHAVSQYEAQMVPWLIVYADSCKGELALIEDLQVDPDWISVRIAVADDNLKTLDASFMSQEALDEKLRLAEANGTLDIAFQEVLSKPTSNKGKPFPNTMFPDSVYFNEGEVNFDLPGMETFVMVDPARSDNPRADESGIVCATVDTQNQHPYFRYGDGLHLQPDELWEASIDRCLEFGATFLGVEFAGLKLHGENAVREHLTRRRCDHITLIDLKPQTGKGQQSGYYEGKNARIIWGLRSWCHWGIVRFDRNRAYRIVEQLLQVPTGKRKDIADAAAYLRQMLEQLDIHFDMPEEIRIAGRPEPASRTAASSYLSFYDSPANRAAAFDPVSDFSFPDYDGPLYLDEVMYADNY